MKAFFSTAFGKILIGILAAAVVAGGGFAVYQAVQSDSTPVAEITEPETEEATTAEAATEETTTEEEVTEPPTEAPTEAPTVAPTTTKATTTTAKPTTKEAVQQVIELTNTDTSKGWIAGPYKFAYDGTKWVYYGAHAYGLFEIPAGYELRLEETDTVKGGNTTERLYYGHELWKTN